MLKTLLNADEEQYYTEMEEAERGMRFQMAHPKLQRFLDAWYWLKYHVLSCYCRLTDHVIEDTSYGGPDSGEMSGHCTRCGWSYHSQLY